MRKGRQFDKAFVAGMVGGLFASWAMNQYWAILGKMQEKRASPAELEQMRKSQQQREVKNPTVKVAAIIAEDIFHHRLEDHEKKLAGPLVHYAFGTFTGGVYGMATELAPGTAAGWGTAYGGMVWLGADEIGVPALGLSKSPVETPLSQHLEALGAHLVYGFVLETVRRPLRWIL